MSARRTPILQFGLFAAVAVALTAFIVLRLVDVTMDDRIALTATFDDVGGLQTGDGVQLAGVPVGTVRAVDVVEGAAEVRFEVDATTSVPADSAVAVRWLDLIGQRELEIFPGDSQIQASDGDRLTHTRSVVDIARLVDELGPFAESLDPSQLNELLESFTTILGDDAGGIPGIVGDLDTVLAVLAERDDTIRRMLADYATVSDVLARRDRQIQTLLDNAAVISEAFAESEHVLDDALVHLSGTASDLDAVLDASAGDLGAVVDDLAKVTDLVTDRLGDLDATVAALPQNLNALFSMVARGSYLAVDITCNSTAPPPCPAGGNPTPSRLDTPADFRRLLVGEAP